MRLSEERPHREERDGMHLKINGHFIGEIPTTFKDEGVAVASMTMEVVHDDNDSSTEIDMMAALSEVYRYSGDQGTYWVLDDGIETDSDNMWRVHKDGCETPHRVGLTMPEAIEQAFNLCWTKLDG